MPYIPQGNLDRIREIAENMPNDPQEDGDIHAEYHGGLIEIQQLCKPVQTEAPNFQIHIQSIPSNHTLRLEFSLEFVQDLLTWHGGRDKIVELVGTQIVEAFEERVKGLDKPDAEFYDRSWYKEAEPTIVADTGDVAPQCYLCGRYHEPGDIECDEYFRI